MTRPKSTGAAPPNSGQRLDSLDIFRGACALSVFLTHWLVWANFRPVNEAERLLLDSLNTVYAVFRSLTWDSGGLHPAVLGFFVLSGFCIHASRAQRSESGWGRYFRRRARRILPVYWWGALLGVGFLCLQNNWPSPNPILQLHATGNWLDLVRRVFALNGLVPGDVVLGNWSLNTVASEITIYALYPLLYLGTRRFGWGWLLAGLIILQKTAELIAPHVSPNWLVGTPLIMGAYWYLGMLAAEWHFRRQRALSGWVPVLTWGLFLLLREAPDFPARYVVVQLVRALGFATLLLWMVGRETYHPPFGRSAPGRFMRQVGEVSYSLYVVHTPVIMATSWALGLLPATRNNSLQLLVTMLATLAATAVTYRLIERPGLSANASAARLGA